MRRTEERAALSERENEVLFLAAEGLTDKEISARLEIRAKTVRTYWDRIRAKLGAASRTQALAIALRAALDDLAGREERLRTFVDAMPVAFFAFSEDLTVIACNREAQELTGYSEEELSGTRLIYGLAIPDEIERVRMVRRWRTSRGEFRNWEMPITRKDGATRVVSWSSTSHNHPVPGWRTWAIGFDVSDLHTARSKLHFVVQSAGEGMWLLDPEWKTEIANERMAEILEIRLEDLSTLSPRNRMTEEDWSKAESALDSGLFESAPVPLLRVDGTPAKALATLRPFLGDQGEVLGYLVIAEPAPE